LKIVSETEGGEAVTTDPRDYMVEPLRDEFALRSTLQRRKIRKPFDVDDITEKRLSKSSAGLVLLYSPERQLFKVMYEAD
jgi:hypothetical protein